MNFIKDNLTNVIGFILGFAIVIGCYMFIAYSNINDQAKATIDYVYSVETGGNPEISDTWLAEQYCNNEVALNVAYPDFKDKCNYITSQAQKDKVELEKRNEE